jgi:hypothetical protein
LKGCDAVAAARNGTVWAAAFLANTNPIVLAIGVLGWASQHARPVGRADDGAYQ